MDSDSDIDFEDRVACFPCMFTKDSFQASTERMKEIKIKLQDELDVDDDCYEETIAKLNFYTWIEYKLTNYDRARGHNERALKLSSGENITSLVNHAHIMLSDGEEACAEKSLVKAEKLRKSREGPRLMTDLEAELAYSYSRLNGPENLSRAIEIYERVVDQRPEMYGWKYRFGLAHRRATHGNMYTGMRTGFSHTEHTRRAAKQLFDVARESEFSSLRSRAYSQLAVMCSYSKFLNDTECGEIFDGYDFKSLTEEALKYGPNDARTLAECGRILRYTELEKATELLEKSLKIKKHSITFHHLGLCYDKKARDKSFSEIKEKQRQVRGQGSSNQMEYTIETDSVACQSSVLETDRSPRDGRWSNYSNANHDRRDISYSSSQREKYSKVTGYGSAGSIYQSNAGKTWNSRQEYDFKTSEYFSSRGRNVHFYDKGSHLVKHNQNYKPDLRSCGSHSSDSRPLYSSQDIRNEGLIHAGKSNYYTSRGAISYSNSYHHEQDKAVIQQYTGRNDLTREQKLSSERRGTGSQQVFSYQDSRYEPKMSQVPNSYRGQGNRHNQEGQHQSYNRESKRFERQHSYSEQDSRYVNRNQLTRQNSLGTQRSIDFQRGFRGRTPNKRMSASFIRCPINVLPLNRDDPLVSQAIECFTQALDISYDSNNPARYNLGLILRSCGDIHGALKQFNKIIRLTSGPGVKRVKNKENREYLITVTCAYEQSGLCYLELGKEEGKSEEETNKLNEDAERKLMQAVGLAATLSNLDPKMRNHYKLVWNAFRTLENKFVEEDESPEIIKKYIQLLILTSNFEKIPRVIEKLRRLSEEELADPKVLKSGLESYLTLHQYEDAFTFLSVSLTNNLLMDCLQELHSLTLKVRLFTAASRLQTQEGSAKLILKPLFDSRLESEVTGSENEKGEASVEEDVELQKETYRTDDDVLDVLIVYDTNSGDDVTEQVKKLQQTISCDFGLDVNNIDARRFPGRLKIVQQTEEISRARTVLVLLSEDSQSSISFTSLLEFIPVIITDCKENGRPGPEVLVGLTHDAVKIPRLLKTYNKIDMSEILDIIEIISEEEEEYLDELSESEASQTDVKQLVAQHKNEMAHVKTYHSNPYRTRDDTLSQDSPGVFGDCVHSKMSLFCALINQEWTTLLKSQSV